MKVAVTMVRDEADVIGFTLAHMLTQVDHAIVADNLSLDSTPDILASFGDQVTIIRDLEPGYYQADKMTRLAHLAGDMGAEWVIPFDADEAWYLPDLDTIEADVVRTSPFVYVPQLDDPDDPNPITRICHRMTVPERQAKVCFRYHPDVELHMGQHDVERPGHRTDAGTVRHYQYRTLEQVRRKVSNGVGAYNASDLPHRYGSHWRELDAFDDAALERWWADYIGQPVVYDP